MTSPSILQSILSTSPTAFQAYLPRLIVSRLGASQLVGGVARELLGMTPPSLHAGSSSLHLPLISPTNQNPVAVVVTDRGVRDLGLELNACESLKKAGLDVYMFDGVQPNPSAEVVELAAQFSKDVRASVIVGLGGGSSMDVAKLAAFLAAPNQKQSLSDIYGVGKAEGPRIPLIQIPTTSGTGSESTSISIITDGDEKKGVVSPQLFADAAVLDGELTLKLPRHITAATGVDACVHAIEAMTSKVKRNPFSDSFAKRALELLGANLRTVCDPKTALDPEARQAMLLGSMYAGVAFANAPVGAVHALAYPIGTLFNVPHGVSISLMLPHVLRFNDVVPQAASVYDDVRRIVFGKEHPTMDLADSFASLSLELGLPSRLSEVGIAEDDVGDLVDGAMKQTRLLPNNAREVKREDAEMLFRKAL